MCGYGARRLGACFAAALGVTVLIAQSAITFNFLKYLGAAYLVYLGIRMLMRQEAAFNVAQVESQGAGRAFREAVLVEALNVKTALFFLAFLPQFVLPELPLIPQLVVMGGICVALNTAVDVLAVFVASRVLASGTARIARAKLLNRASGFTMLGLGAYLAVARRETGF